MQIEVWREKGTGDVNEDTLVAKAPVFAVFDGATSLDATSFQGKTGGEMAAQIAADTFSGGDPRPLSALALVANNRIGMAMRAAGIYDRDAFWSTSAAVVRICDGAVEWFQTGDSLVLARMEDGSVQIPGGYHNHDAKTLQEWRELADAGLDRIRERLDRRIREVRSGMNREYGVLNGEKGAGDFFHSGRLPLSMVQDLLLVTDGCFLPTPEPAVSPDFSGMVTLVKKGGLSLLRDRVREMEDLDPACTRYPRFKHHDDMAAIAISKIH